MDVSPAQAEIDAHRSRCEALKAAGTQGAAALPPTPPGGRPIDNPRRRHSTIGCLSLMEFGRNAAPA